MPTLGRFIQRRRIELGLTQEELAEMIGGGVRQSEISRLEHDRISLPRRQRLEQIAVALDVSLGELLARSGWAGAEEEFDGKPTGPDLESDAVTADRIVPDAAALTAAITRAEELIAVSDKIVEKAQVTYDEAQRALRHGNTGRTEVPTR